MSRYIWLLKIELEDLESLNRWIIRNEIETIIIKSLPTKKSTKPDGFNVELYHMYKEYHIAVPLKLSQGIVRGKMLPNSLHKTSVILIPKPDRI